MVSDYKNADGDYRGVLERYLPTAYKTIGNGSDVHRGLLGALKQMLVTTEQDIIDGTRQVFLANANSWALDLYGDWVGESRKGELDDDYRARIIEKITLGRNTVGNIIAGIKREVNDPDLTVSVYEPWRNIFILNKSLLNGADRLMGNFYRYAVIQVTLNKYVNALELQVIADKYKSAGVSVVFVYREGIVAGDGTLLALPLRLINEGRNTVNWNRSHLYGNLLMNGLPTGAKETNLFTVNESDINGTDVLASDPNSLYSNAYGTVPSKNIFGTTASNAGMTSDPFDFVYQQSKVDMSTLWGRNLILGTRTPFTQGGNGLDNQDLFNKAMFYSPLKNWGIAGAPYTVSFDWELNAPLTAPMNLTTFFNAAPWQTNMNAIPVGQTTGHISYTINLQAGLLTSTPDVTSLTFRVNSQLATGNSITYSNLKFETGTLATPWTPAPEDTPKIYIHPYTGTDYTALNRLDGVTETVTASGLPTVAFNISEYVNRSLEAKALNDATRGGTVGRNYVLNSSGLNGSSTVRPALKGGVSGANVLLTYPADGILMTNGATNKTTEWYYQVASAWTNFSSTPLTAGGTYTFSADVMGTVPQAVLRWGFNGGTGGGEYSRNFNINNTSWTRVSITTTPSPSNTGMYWRIQGGINNQYATGWTGGETLKFRNVKIEQGAVATPWTPAPEDNPTSVDYTNFSTPVSSININLKGSPFGLAPTTINVLSQGGTPLTGKWYKNGKLISPQTPQVSDPVTPTGTWSFKLDTPTLVSSVTITDNYPDAKGSYRVITLSTTNNRELVLLNTTQQVTGTINTVRLQTQTPEIYRPYIKSATIGDTTLTSPQVFDATTGHWIDITATTELVPYITYGDITDSLYVTLRNKTAQQKIDYLGLNVTKVSVEGQ